MKSTKNWRMNMPKILKESVIAIAPTPWSRDKWGAIRDANKNIVSVSGFAIPSGYVPLDDVSYAHGQLLLVAPDLLEALTKAYEYIFAEDGPDKIDREELATEMESAIKKAVFHAPTND